MFEWSLLKVMYAGNCYINQMKGIRTYQTVLIFFPNLFILDYRRALELQQTVLIENRREIVEIIY